MLRNGSIVMEFILVGFQQSSTSTQALLFALFLALYSLTMAMNGLIIFITWTDPKLNSSMYFFLGHLSFLDVCSVTTTIPQMLIHLVVRNHIVSFVSCMTQMYFVFCVGVAECILLAFMACDRYVAICYPLNYVQIISQKSVSGLWELPGSLVYFIPRALLQRQPHRKLLLDWPLLWGPSGNLCQCHRGNAQPRGAVTSYVHILATILSRASSSGRGKTFSTCASHLTVVIFLYTSAMFSYMNPHSTHGPDKDKLFSLLYTIITPHVFHNKEIKEAMVRALGRTRLAQPQSV
uniref:G-protein coupled receptors family 1 profile domain-containing protein n=1 Tax=Nomascus leucogenys TaxID=61853 RepID=A0A2I3GB97_NOMLE